MSENPAPTFKRLSCAVDTEEIMGPMFYNSIFPAVLATPKSEDQNPLSWSPWGVYAATTNVAGTEF